MDIIFFCYFFLDKNILRPYTDTCGIKWFKVEESCQVFQENIITHWIQKGD